MTRYVTRISAAALIASVGAFAPVSIDPAALDGTGGESLFRLSEACGQASSCAPMTNYICSTANGDHMHYTCNSGCGGGGGGGRPFQPAYPTY